ncbi:MAG TPA: glycosyltransferase family 2 protein [Candidatus Babeliales bacterium]|nr:glycosyltransferase family 2 protein [Candidatus Babeliales bacterium]
MLKNLKLVKLVLIFAFVFIHLVVYTRSYVVIIPSYNNIKWWQKNIESVLELETIPGQIDYRIIYIDDCSTDGTGVAVEQYVKNWKSKTGSNLDIKIIHNNTRQGAMSNWYHAIHSCSDDEVMVSVDGDDWLAHKQVLLRLEQEYTRGCWLTYGQWAGYPNGKPGRNNKKLSTKARIRHQPFMTSHLRTFYAGLFKQINLKDFLDSNHKFYAMACDVAMMIPMIEMCGVSRCKFITDVLYIYNFSNPISDDRQNSRLQERIAAQIRARSSYQFVRSYKL